jgi:hypothetical protein
VVPVETSHGDVLDRSIRGLQREPVDDLSGHLATRLRATVDQHGHHGDRRLLPSSVRSVTSATRRLRNRARSCRRARPIWGKVNDVPSDASDRRYVTLILSIRPLRCAARTRTDEHAAGCRICGD